MRSPNQKHTPFTEVLNHLDRKYSRFDGSGYQEQFYDMKSKAFQAGFGLFTDGNFPGALDFFALDGHGFLFARVFVCLFGSEFPGLGISKAIPWNETLNH